MTYIFETIKTNKHILRDYLGIINEIIYTIDLKFKPLLLNKKNKN